MPLKEIFMKKLLLTLFLLGISSITFAGSCDCDIWSYTQDEKKACFDGLVAGKQKDDLQSAFDVCDKQYSANNHLREICHNKAQDYRFYCK